MATTSIWKIDSRLDHVIDYTTNIEKTLVYGNSANYQELHNLSEYDKLNFDTESQLYVSSLNCSKETAYEEMMLTKKQYSKTDGILGFHAFQSFKEGEVTPEQAHEIGVKLAQEMWGDRFEVIVSTHFNTKHYHNHFVINSVSFKDGKKYYDNRVNYAKLRELSDSLCQEYGLSVLKEKPCKNSMINYANYYKKYIETDNYYTIAKKDIDRAIAMAYSYTDFENLLKAMDYEIIYRGKNILSVRRDPYKKNIRIERSFGTEYSIKRIKERIDEEKTIRIPFIEEYGIKKPKRFVPYHKKKHKGLYSLFIHYCYLLKVFPKKYPRKPLPAYIRVDIKEMDSISKQTELLVKNKIVTDEQFLLFKQEKEKNLDNLQKEKEDLWKEYNKSKNNKDKRNIRLKIDSLYKVINAFKYELKLCDLIEERSTKIKNNIKNFEENKQRGKDKNDNIRGRS